MTRLAVAFALRVSETFSLDVAFEADLPEDAPVVALFGPSGSGKSTTIAVLAGLARPDRGSASLGGEPLVDVERGVDLPPERRAVGLVAQDGLLFPHLTVAGNLAYAERRRRGRAAPARDAVIETLRLAPLLPRRPATLSGGERQRVALGRALLSGPRLLLLDEPVSALDLAARREALDFVAETIRRFRVPTLFVSHHEAEVLRIARVAVRLDAGRVVASGPSQDVLSGARAGEGVDNVFRAVYAASEHRDVASGPGGSTLQLPHAGTDGESVWCRVASGAIALEPADATTLTSARNRLAGRVVALRREPHLVRVAVDAGVVLQADVTPEAAEALRLTVGGEIRCVFKTHSIEVLR
jgi:molybdate transport system ATP-binding protein